jgi:hypothetical protein
MKLFNSPDGRIIQLADEKKMERWDAEMPLLFIGNMKEKQLPYYRKEFPKNLVAEIEKYLDSLLESVAIPKLIKALTSPKVQERIKVAESFEKLSDTNPDLLTIALSHVENACKDPDKTVSELMKKTLKNYQKAQKRKQTIEKRKILTEMRKKMDQLDDQLGAGEITDEVYMQEQKKFLKLKHEITVTEMDDDEKQALAQPKKKK